MIEAGLTLALLALIFSLYQLFVANDAVNISVGILRTMIAIVGIVAIRFDNPVVLASAVLLYAGIAIFVLAVNRKEVQIKHD